LADPEDIVLADISRTGTIPLNGLRVAQDVTIPAVPPGSYFLLATVPSNSGFANTGTNAPILGVSTDFRVTDLEISPYTLNLQEAFNFEWSASIENQGLNRALATWDAILSRDRKIGNGDDVILEGEGLPFLDLMIDQTGILSEFESIIGSAMPSGSYYFGLRVRNTTDPTPNNNIFVTAKPIIAVIGDSDTDSVFTMRGGAGLDTLITNDVPAIRGNGTGFGPIQETGDTKVHTFEISNDGAMPLQILLVEGRGQHPEDFAISNSFTTPIAPGSTRTYTVTFDPTDYANRRANFLFTTNDPNREQFRMRIAGQGKAAPTDPDIEVVGGRFNTPDTRFIENNDKDPAVIDGTDFEQLAQGADGFVSLFTIRNVGQAALVFQQSPDPQVSIRAHTGDAANSFKFGRSNATNVGHLTGIPDSLTTGQTFTFRVKFDPTAFGRHKPWIEIYTNDPDEPLFRFKVVGLFAPF